MEKLAGFAMILFGAGAGVVSSAVLYFAVVGLLSLATGLADDPGTSSLISRSIEFGIVFGPSPGRIGRLVQCAAWRRMRCLWQR